MMIIVITNNINSSNDITIKIMIVIGPLNLIAKVVCMHAWMKYLHAKLINLSAI